jgi:hypothetical protein
MTWKSVLGKVVGCPGKFGDVTVKGRWPRRRRGVEIIDCRKVIISTEE